MTKSDKLVKKVIKSEKLVKKKWQTSEQKKQTSVKKWRNCERSEKKKKMTN